MPSTNTDGQPDGGARAIGQAEQDTLDPELADIRRRYGMDGTGGGCMSREEVQDARIRAAMKGGSPDEVAAVTEEIEKSTPLGRALLKDVNAGRIVTEVMRRQAVADQGVGQEWGGGIFVFLELWEIPWDFNFCLGIFRCSYTNISRFLETRAINKSGGPKMPCPGGNLTFLIYGFSWGETLL